MKCFYCEREGTILCDRPTVIAPRLPTVTCSRLVCTDHAFRRGNIHVRLASKNTMGSRSEWHSIDWCQGCQETYSGEPSGPSADAVPERTDRGGVADRGIREVESPRRQLEAPGSGPAASGHPLPGPGGGEAHDFPHRVRIDYENHAGVRRSRVVIPIKIEYRTSKYHFGTQWIMDAHDCEDDMKVKDFALMGLYPAWQVAEMEEPKPNPKANPPFPRQQRLPGIEEERMR